jgi:hypothetical protein
MCLFLFLFWRQAQRTVQQAARQPATPPMDMMNLQQTHQPMQVDTLLVDSFVRLMNNKLTV